MDVQLPDHVTISTMSATCKLGTVVSLPLISEHIKISDDGILSIKYKDSFRTVLPVVKKGRSKKVTKLKNFFNQITMEVRVNEDRKINLKLFCNGSVQMTGCKSPDDCSTAVQRLIDEVKDIQSDEPVCNLDELGMHGFKVDMINSNFKMNYMINRRELHNHITNKPNIYSRFDPNNHAGLIIKYFGDNDNKKGISIFVFESGNIIITGAKNRQHIMIAYNYITQVLKDHDVRKIDIESLMKRKVSH
jgi:TATA-box binding protein (TBP) (component of TFIID and TFIIIB)